MLELRPTLSPSGSPSSGSTLLPSSDTSSDVLIVSRIQDQTDFTNPPVDDYFIKWDAGTQKFVMADIPEVEEERLCPTDLAITEPTDVTQQPTSTVVVSGAITVSGDADRLYPVTCKYGKFKTSTGEDYITDGFVQNGESITLKQTTAATINTEKTTTLIGDSGYFINWKTTTAIYPNVTSSRLWFDRNARTYTDTAGTTLAGVGDPVRSWRSAGGAWGDDVATRVNESFLPYLRSNGIQGGAGPVRMSIPTPITISAGTTIYVALVRPVVADYVGAYNNAAGYGMFAGNTVIYVASGAGWTVFSNNQTGHYCIRIRYTLDNLTKCKPPNVTELSQSVTITPFAFQHILTGNGTSGNDTNTRINQVVVVQKNIVPGDADDLAILNTISGLESGILLP